MPASSVSAIVTTSLYLLSSGLFVAMAYTPISGTLQASEMGEAVSVVDGLQAQIDSLAPGITANIGYGQTIVPMSVSLSGHSIIAQVAGQTVERQASFALPHLQLQAGSEYPVSLVGGELTLEKSGLD